MVSKKHIAIAALNIQTVWSKLNHKSGDVLVAVAVAGRSASESAERLVPDQVSDPISLSDNY